eukprot:5447535-Prymnesium_polylepis.1
MHSCRPRRGHAMHVAQRPRLTPHAPTRTPCASHNLRVAHPHAPTRDRHTLVHAEKSSPDASRTRTHGFMST